jgi:hypothetical protein
LRSSSVFLSSSEQSSGPITFMHSSFESTRHTHLSDTTWTGKELSANVFSVRAQRMCVYRVCVLSVCVERVSVRVCVVYVVFVVLSVLSVLVEGSG